MRASRGMGCIAPSKMPSAKNKARRDNTDFTQYKSGGEVWNKPRPSSIGAPKPLGPMKKRMAKAAAAKAGRPYPNMIDNIRVARSK